MASLYLGEKIQYIQYRVPPNVRHLESLKTKNKSRAVEVRKQIKRKIDLGVAPNNMRSFIQNILKQ